MKFRKNLRKRLHVHAGVFVFAKRWRAFGTKWMPVRVTLYAAASFGPASTGPIMPEFPYALV
jgi:hypothetical protein